MRKLAAVSFPLLVSVIALVACKHDDAASSSSEGGAPSAQSNAGASTKPTAPTGAATLRSDFEGTIAMHVTGGHGAHDLTFLTKGGKLRVDVPEHNGAMAHAIFDPQASKMFVILDAQKTYMEMDQGSVASAAAAAHPTAPPQIVKTGKHETVAGMDCEDWTTTEADGKHAALCVAQGIAFFDFASMAPGAAAPSAWINELKTQKYFPLRAIDTDATGKEVSRMEVTKIEKKTVDDSLFAPPAGYQAMSMPMIPHGVPGMPSNLPGMPPGFTMPAHH